MKTRVFIPFTNEKVFGGIRGRNRYRPEFASWMIETFGQTTGGFWGAEPGPSKHLSHARSGMVFWFKEPMHAMTFKLTWV